MKVFRNIFLFFIVVWLGYQAFLMTIQFNKTELTNLSNGEVEIIGHGGVGFSSYFPFKYYPSNSYGSLSKAINKYDVGGVEVDLHMTKDRKFVLFHDSKLEKKTKLTGCLSDYTLAELTAQQYQLGAPFDWFQSERIIGLGELIDSLKELDEFPQLHLDVRPWSPCMIGEESLNWERDMALELIKFLGSKGVALDKVVIITLSQNFLIHLKVMKNPYPISFEIVGAVESSLKFAIDYSVSSITVKPSLLTKELSATAHKNGLKVITFGAKSKSGNKKLLELNPDIIQTDNISALKDLMGYK